MPSIELISVEEREPSSLPKFPFAIRAETERLSHREPSMFQRDFDQSRGCIYHLGSPCCDDPGYEGPFFAYDLLSERCRDAAPIRCVEFAPEFLPAVFDLIGLLLAASPARQVIFTTDWQCGPPSPRRYRPMTERTFWQRHARQKLRMNALYTIRSGEI